jgi:hypothetical protein
MTHNIWIELKIPGIVASQKMQPNQIPSSVLPPLSADHAICVKMRGAVAFRNLFVSQNTGLTSQWGHQRLFEVCFIWIRYFKLLTIVLDNFFFLYMFETSDDCESMKRPLSKRKCSHIILPIH